MHGIYYANEVRNFGEIPKAENVKASADEIELGAALIESMSMSDEFKPEKYRNKYRERLQAMLDERTKRREITVATAAAPRHGQVIDLMHALKQSMEHVRRKRKAATAQKKRKSAS
jgi:DNA end-binding protein Ku